MAKPYYILSEKLNNNNKTNIFKDGFKFIHYLMQTNSHISIKNQNNIKNEKIT